MEALGPLFSQLATLENLMLQIAVSAIIVAFARVFPTIAASAAFGRLAPVLPLALCALAVAVLPLPAWSALPVVQRALLGVTLGVGAGWAHKLVKQSLLGSDQRIGSAPVPAAPSSSPANPLLVLAGAAVVGGLASSSGAGGAPAGLDFAAYDPPLPVVATSSTASVAEGLAR